MPRNLCFYSLFSHIWEFLDQISKWPLLKNCFAMWRYAGMGREMHLMSG